MYSSTMRLTGIIAKTFRSLGIIQFHSASSNVLNVRSVQCLLSAKTTSLRQASPAVACPSPRLRMSTVVSVAVGRQCVFAEITDDSVAIIDLASPPPFRR